MRLEFIRRLRAKGYNDLALEKIDELKANPDAAEVVPLERARTLSALARAKDASQRPPLFAAARAELDAFVRAHPSGVSGAEGRLEIARLAAYQGQALLTRAVREEDTAVAKKAEKQFIDAGQALEAATKVLAGLAANYKNADPDKEKRTKQQLASELLQARFDRAGNYMDQAETFIDKSSEAANLKSAELINKAKTAFTALADDGGSVGLLASAWLVKVNQEGQDPPKAEYYRKRVMRATGMAAQPAQRLARLFYIQGIPANPSLAKLDRLKKYKLIEEESKRWLAAYPAFQKSPEGWQVRYELAQSFYFQGQTMTKDTKAAPGVAAMFYYNQAQKQLAAIAASDSEWAEKAKALTVNISVLKLGDKTIADLKDFNNCYLKAQVELFNMKKVAGELAGAAPKDRDKLEAQRTAHLRAVLKALTRGLALADAKTSRQSLDDARYLLATGYLMAGDSYRAAVAGEDLARSRPPSKHSAQAAGYALEAYADIVQRDGADGNRRRLQDLADFILSPAMQKQWANEPATNVARYRLAMLYNKDKDYRRALAQLAKLTPDYTGFIYAQGQLVFIAEEARAKAKSDADKKEFTALARKAVLRIPNLPDDADPATAAMYFFARLELARFYYADGAQALENKQLPKAAAAYGAMERFVAGLKTQLDKTPSKLADDTRAKLEFSMKVMGEYARLGQAELDYRKGNYDKVLQTTGAVVAALDKLKGDGTSPIRLKDYQITGDVLTLALRANVQKGNTGRAEQILGYLNRLTGEEGVGAAETTNVLRSLIGDLQVQVKELKKTNDPAKLKATVKNFSAFIDKLVGNRGKALGVKDVMFLATCYSSLEEYAKAAQLYAKIAPPKFLDNDKLSDEEEKEVASYWYLQVQYAKALRLSARGKQDLAKAKKVLDDLVHHKNARMQLYAEVEQIHILQDAGLYGYAMKGWAKIMNNPSLKAKLADEPNLKEVYFNAYYENTWCLYKYSQTPKVIAAGKERKYLAPAANNIVRLEKSANQEGWLIVGPRFRELLAGEPKLKAAYEDLKRAAK